MGLINDECHCPVNDGDECIMYITSSEGQNLSTMVFAEQELLSETC